VEKFRIRIAESIRKAEGKSVKMETRIKKSDLKANTTLDYKYLSRKRVGFVSCDLIEDDEELVINYKLQGLKAFSQLRSEDLANKYQCLINLSKLEELWEEFTFELTEANLYYDENFGLSILSRDLKHVDDKRDFFIEYLYLVCGILNKKYTGDEIALGGLSIVGKDKACKDFVAFVNVEEVVSLLRSRKVNYIDEIKNKKVLVDKGKHTRNRIISRGVIVILVAALLYTSYQSFVVLPKKEATIAAGTAFVSSGYVEVIDSLEGVKVEDMDTYTKYVLATAYAKSETMDKEAMANVIAKITMSSNVKELDYWIYLGRRDTDKAVNLAKALSDDKLLIWAYMTEVNMLENDTDIDGKTKDDKLKALNESIKTLGEKYLPKDEA
jgi:type VII secretion protein EssB